MTKIIKNTAEVDSKNIIMIFTFSLCSFFPLKVSRLYKNIVPLVALLKYI